VPLEGPIHRSVVVALARLLGADSPVDLPLVVLTGLVEHGQHYDRAIWSSPVPSSASIPATSSTRL
jgi:hypothetical protein